MTVQTKPLVWHPIYDAHAVEQTVLIFQFESQMEQNDFHNLYKTANEKFTDDFPRRGLMPNPMIAVGVGSPPPLMLPGISSTGIFQKYQPDGQIDSELRFDGFNITFRTLKYTRWEKIWESSFKYICELLPVYIRNNKLGAVGLQYSNKFIFTDKRSDRGVASLLRTNSKYISPYTFELDDLWHNHTGAFLRPDNHSKRLNNINIDQLDEQTNEGQDRVLRVNIALSDTFQQNGYEPLTVNERDINDFCRKRMDNLHSLNKKLLSDIISDEMIKRIDLWAA